MKQISWDTLFSKESVKDFFLLNAGTLLVALGVYFFRLPNNFTTGGVSGFAVLLGKLVPGISKGTMVWILNIFLLALGFLFINGKFGVKTVYSSMLFSAALWVLERVCPLSQPLTNQPFLELIFSVLVPAFGSAILFHIDASTGGSDITAMILKKFLHMDIGRALLSVDCFVAVAACFLFGMETGLFSILGLLMKAFLVDSIMENFNICKYFNIVTSQPERIAEFVTKELNRSATQLEGTGWYTGQDKSVLLVVLNRPQAVRLRAFLKVNDPGAFVTIVNTSTIIGKGFRSQE